MEQIIHVNLEELHPPEFDHRLTTEPLQDIELQESIKELGILEPLIIKKIKKGYEIIIGNRRYRAAGIVGLPSAPCVVVKSTGEHTEKMKIHENIFRHGLNHIDQAYTFAYLIEKYKMTEEKVAKLVGKSTGYISQHLSLISSNDKLIAAVQVGDVTFSTARELLRVKDIDERERLQEQIVDHGASVSVVKTWVNEANRETLGTGPDGNKYEPTEDSPPSYKTTYPCQACNRSVEVAQLKIVRLCPECEYQIFSAIKEQQKEMEASNQK